MGLIDIHCHLLPQVDDGRLRWEDMEEVFKLYQSCGIDSIIFTPHLYNPYVSTRTESLKPSFLKAKGIAEACGISVSLSSEVFVKDQKVLKALPLLGRFALVEFSTTYAPIGMMEKLETLSPLIPIIAHVERYSWLEPDSPILVRMKDLGYLFQVNGKALRPGSKAEKYVKSGIVDFLASDCHGDRRDIIDFAEALSKNPDIMKKMSQYRA